MVDHALMNEKLRKILVAKKQGDLDLAAKLIIEYREAHRSRPFTGSSPTKTFEVKKCSNLSKALDSIVKTTCICCGGKEMQVEHRAYECKVHNRCIPSYQPKGERLVAWNERKPESDLYHLCGEGYCDSYEVPS